MCGESVVCMVVRFRSNSFSFSVSCSFFLFRFLPRLLFSACVCGRVSVYVWGECGLYGGSVPLK